MNTITRRIIAIGLLATFGAYGCTGKPNRKKLPDFNASENWEKTPKTQTSVQPYYAGDTLLNDGSLTGTFQVIAIPDPSFDSLAISLALNYQPLAGALRETWIAQGRKGIVIDLRPAAFPETYRADVSVQCAFFSETSLTLPLVILWNNAANYRAAYYLEVLGSMPAINCRFLSNNSKLGNKGNLDCFNPGKPGFGGN